jgi:pyroglutamyl-peptidase
MPAMRVLLTGFEPFLLWDVNPSAEVVRTIGRDPPPASRLATRILPVDFVAAGPRLREAIDGHDAELVLMLGQGGGTAIRVERVGLNLNDIPGTRDNAGRTPEEELIDPQGPDAYFATIPVRALVKHLEACGIPAVESRTAGTFLCNHVLYAARHHCALTGRATRVGFLHLPLLPAQAAADPSREKPGSMALETQIAGVRAALEMLSG